MKWADRTWVRPLNGYGDQTACHSKIETSKWTSEHNSKEHHSIDAEWRLRDCNVEVSLDAYATKPKHVLKHLDAIDTVLASLTTFREKLVVVARHEWPHKEFK